MTKLFITVLATMGIALGTAATASASEGSFLDAVESQGHYSTLAPGTDDEAVAVGYRACGALDRQGVPAAVAEVRSAYNGDTSEFANYFAELFVQAATQELCPQHAGAVGPI